MEFLIIYKSIKEFLLRWFQLYNSLSKRDLNRRRLNHRWTISILSRVLYAFNIKACQVAFTDIKKINKIVVKRVSRVSFVRKLFRKCITRTSCIKV